MNPIKLSKQLQAMLVSYLTTTFDVNRDGQEPALAAFIRQSLNRPRALFAGPYLEFTPPYKTAESLTKLVEQGVLAPQLLQMRCFQEGRPLPIDLPLYTHQAAAIRKVCAENRNLVVASGTGSGKSESFLIPILNDLMVDPTPGVRAVLIYPLNALVNDQLDRLRVLLRDTEITFGRYTSELEQKADRARDQMKREWRAMEPARYKLFDQYPLPNEIIGRDQIQEQGLLPQILITNYAMLEYLLLRPQDNPLFMQGKWRFIVLDEAHTYAGSQGIEVGLLMRRLKLRLSAEPGKTRCIATSATLTDDDASDACRFASTLFGEEFAPDDIIFGEPDRNYAPAAAPRQPDPATYIHPKFDALIDIVRREQWESSDELALLLQEIGLIGDEELDLVDDCTPAQFLWTTLRSNKDLERLRTLMAESGQPVEVTSIAEQLFHGRLPAGQQETALYHLIELAAMARSDVDKPSLLPARYHLFVRPPQGVWACLNPACPDKHDDNQWSRLFAAPRTTCDACGAPVYPLVVCRTCGQVYLRLMKPKQGRKYLAEVGAGDEPTKRYVTWRPISENLALAETDEEETDEDNLVEQTGENNLIQAEIRLCLDCQEKVNGAGRCGCPTPSQHIVPLYLLQKKRAVKSGRSTGTTEVDVEELDECGRCHSRALKGSEVATEVTMDGLTPLAVLTQELYRVLPVSEQPEVINKPGGGRKLISFYDSRQGAARFAAFVQDVVNQQAYRQIIAEAVDSLSKHTYWPDTEKVSERCLELVLKYQVAANDLELRQEGLDVFSMRHLSHSQKERLMRHIHKRLIAEMTTELRSRQALESLGLLSVQYFDPDRPPNFDKLAYPLNLTELEARTLVEYLLDDLRRGKVITLPESVLASDAVFGRNKFSPRLVRRDAQRYEVAWIGKTVRHRRRQLVAKMLRYKGLASDDQSVIAALQRILNWLVDDTEVFDISRPKEGYQIRHKGLLLTNAVPWCRCDQCQRISSRGTALPCPRANCHGTLRPIAIDRAVEDNFFYTSIQQRTLPMRIEEHTAQLEPEKGRDYQNKFKSGDINMLSCSTTFELGIDLGDLQAVVMSNIPPTVANYKQRAGRAGRRAGGTAFILAWAANRPHDQTYFKAPAEIIAGRVRVPYIDVRNPVVFQRHVNAVLLSEFLRYCKDSFSVYEKAISAFFDVQSPTGPYYDRLPLWRDERQGHLLALLGRYAQTAGQNTDPAVLMQTFEQQLRNHGYAHYQMVADFYKNVRTQLASQQYESIQSGTAKREESEISKEIERYRRLLTRLQEEDAINYLSDRGILPSYSFPIHVVELRIPYHLEQSSELRLQRSLPVAIREYAPGQEVIADKRIWKSEALDFFGKEPQVFGYHICPNCNHLQLVDTPGKTLDVGNKPCPVCQVVPPRNRQAQHQYIQPDGFRASANSGQPAGQYVDRPFNLMRSALVPRQVETHSISQVLAVGHDRDGSLLYVNEGFNGHGFKLCPRCGKYISKGGKCDGKLNGGPCPGTANKDTTYTLGFQQQTDTLRLRFSSSPHITLPEPENTSFWLSLLYTLLHGASRALQIERKDIEGVLFPEPVGATWRQSIVLYDNVPGGAGHVKRIQDEIVQVIAAALEIVNCNCEKSCYRCLREYDNQWEHDILDRGPVAAFLRALDADLQGSLFHSGHGLRPVAAVNQAMWLWEAIHDVQQELWMFADRLTTESPTLDGMTWLDLIQQLQQRRVRVQFFLAQLPDQTTADAQELTVAAHLRLLMRNGLKLYQTNRQAPWLVMADPQLSGAWAVCATDTGALTLGGKIPGQLHLTEDTEFVVGSWRQLVNFGGRQVETSELREPANTVLVEVTPGGRGHSEEEYFGDFYAKPVRSMLINDRYLDTADRILNRLGAHIQLAQRGGTLQSVHVKTVRRGDEQSKLTNQLKQRFPPDVKITFSLEGSVHDRFIQVTYADEQRARVVIGKGLDFIHPDGQVDHTFLVFQKP